MKNITIKSVTHCPTCGSECKVEGGTTHHYIPIKKYPQTDKMNNVMETLLKIRDCKDYGNNSSSLARELIQSLNKQD